MEAMLGWNKAVPIVPSDSVDFVRPIRALYVGGVGDVTGVLLDGSTVLISAVPAGTMLEVQFKRINATGTTATLMIGLSMV